MNDGRRPRVCVLHVGGTIGMVRGDEGFGPKQGFLEAYLGSMPELARADVPAHDLVALEPLLDSSDMTPDDWVRIARSVVERYASYDGFVVVHGTDTLAYTASALSFLLPGLGKPIILTGSQLSLADPRSDGRRNLVTAILLAGTLPVPEVCILFAERLFRGNRSQKIHNEGFTAFDSGNFPSLARVGATIELREQLVRAPGGGVPARVELSRRPVVASFRLFPGIEARMIDHVTEPPLEGLVLETYGVGNVPTRDRSLLDAIARATARGVIVVNCSQCHGGAVHQGLYATSSALASAGVVSGHDMTPEAALTKLYCLLATGLPTDVVRARIEQDVAGELTR